MSDFDQQLADDIELAFNQEFMGAKVSHRDAARLAARIAAERQATVVTDEELAKIYDRAYREDVGLPSGYPSTSQACLPAIRAVRQALGAWPQVPQGWRLHEIVSVAGNTRETGFGIVGYNAYLRQNPFDNMPLARGHGPTPAAALQAAINQIGGAE